MHARAESKFLSAYPTLFPKPPWLTEAIESDDEVQMRRYRDELCALALQFYEDRPDGLSTYNWFPLGAPGSLAGPQRPIPKYGRGGRQMQTVVHSTLGSPERLQRLLAEGEH